MSLPQQSYRRITPLTLYGLALGLAVGLFGACYKIEQYPQHGRAFRVMAPAKLLTEKERPQRVVAPRITLASAVRQRPLLRHQPVNLACVDLSALQARSVPARVRSTRRQEIVLPELTFFSFRPPPPRFTS